MAAVAVALAHGLLSVFIVVGAPLAVRRPQMLWWYLAALVPTAAVNLAGMPCPLTVWEQDLWRLAGSTPYRGGFISHYFVEPFHAPGLEGHSETLLLAAVTVWCGAWLLCAATSRLRLRTTR